jgi:hypothetical protein
MKSRIHGFTNVELQTIHNPRIGLLTAVLFTHRIPRAVFRKRRLVDNRSDFTIDRVVRTVLYECCNAIQQYNNFLIVI